MTDVQPVAADQRLLPYIPRLTRDWAAHPGRLHLELDASLVFADLSGFTGLTERLAATGRRGAEEMSTIIADTFDTMLAEAYRAGGSLLKFGGDALLLLFDGPGHEGAAAWAAWEMRSTLRRVSTPHTSVGRIRLGMTSSIATGPVHCFLAGEGQRELIVGGDTVASLLTLERTATTGTTLVSSATAARLAPSTTAMDEDGSIRLVRRPPRPPQVSSFTEPAVAGDISPFVPGAVKRRFDVGETAPEHRRVAVGFIGLGGLDEMIRSDTSGAADALHETVAAVHAIAREHEAWLLGTDVAPDGAKLIVVAGAPVATGHDEASLLLALSDVATLDTPFTLHMGAHHGPVFFGDIGPTYRRTLTVMGDTVNTAARLMAAADPPHVLASTSMLESRHVRFQRRGVRTLELRGRRQPLEVAELTEPARSGTRGVTSPMVGRDRELGRLRALIEEARRGVGAVVEVAGPPGSGRSRLLGEVVTGADVRCLRAEATLHERNVPYSTVRRLFEDGMGMSLAQPGTGTRMRRLAERLSPELLSELAILARPLGIDEPSDPALSDVDPRYLPAMTRRAVASVMAVWAPSPLLVAIDDAHLVDAASWEIIRHAARMAADNGWLVIATAPDGARLDWGDIEIETIDLVRLDADTLTAIALELTEDAPLSTHDLGELVRRSDGNPLLLREMVAARRHDVAMSSIPDAVESITALHIDSLTPERRRQLEVASVLGTVFDPHLYEWVTGDDRDPVEGWDDDLIQVAADGRLRFRNPVTRDVVYDRLPFSHRTQIHRLVADRLGALQAPSDQLAFHLFRAEQWDEAGAAAVEAAQDAARSFAHVSATYWYETALSCARRVRAPTGEIRRLLEGIGESRERAGEYASSAEAYRAAERLAPDAETKARLLVRRAQMLEKMGRYRHALSCLTRARNLAPSAPDVAAAGVARYAGIRFHQGRHGEALVLARRAADMPDDPSSRSHRALALMILDMAQSALGADPDGAASRKSLRLYRELGDLGGQARVTNNLGLFAFYAGDWNEASRLYDESRQTFTRIGDEVDASYGTANLAEIWAAQGRYQEAGELFREVRRIWRAADDRYGAAYIEGQIGLIAAACGRFDEAESRMANAIEGFDEIGARMEIETTAAHLAEAALLSGDPGRAREVIEAFGLAEAAEHGRLASRVARLTATADWQEGRPGIEDIVHAAIHTVRASNDDLDELRLLELAARIQPEADDRRRLHLTHRLGMLVCPVLAGPGTTSHRDGTGLGDEPADREHERPSLGTVPTRQAL